MGAEPTTHLAVEQQLRRAVPPGYHILRHVLGLVGGAREPEVADLEVAVGVEQQVGRLEVAVQHARRVDVLEAAQELVEEVLRETGGGVRVGRERRERQVHACDLLTARRDGR